MERIKSQQRPDEDAATRRNEAAAELKSGRSRQTGLPFVQKTNLYGFDRRLPAIGPQNAALVILGSSCKNDGDMLRLGAPTKKCAFLEGSLRNFVANGGTAGNIRGSCCGRKELSAKCDRPFSHSLFSKTHRSVQRLGDANGIEKRSAATLHEECMNLDDFRSPLDGMRAALATIAGGGTARGANADSNASAQRLPKGRRS